MKPFFKEIFEYTFHFNDNVIELLANAVSVPEKSILLLNHTLNAQEIWNARIEGVACATKVWEIRPTEQLKAINRQNFEKSTEIIENFDFETKVKYANSKGEVFENTVRDMLFHIVNHSTYHRGQIATDCKQHNIEPLITDYIFFKRNSL